MPVPARLAHGAPRATRRQPRAEVLDRQRARQQVALRLVASVGGERVPARRRRDPLPHHAQPEPVAEVDGGGDDRRVAPVRVHAEHELPVDLELVEVEVAQVAQRGLPLAEVVERQPDAERAQPGEHLERALRVGGDQVLGDLEREPLRKAGVALERPGHLRREVEVEQVRGPEVDRDAEVGVQGADLVQRAVEDERRERAREPALLREGQEVARAEQPAHGVLPAHERLDAAHRAARQVGLGLVVHDELPRGDRVAELPHEGEALAAVAVALGQVHLVAGPHPLRLVHRDVRALQQPERIARVQREEGDPDARVDVDGDVLDPEGALERAPQPQAGGARGRLVAG